MHQQPPNRAVEDEAHLRRDSPRRPVADHCPPANDLEAGDLKAVVAHQLQRRGHHRTAAGLGMQPEANLSDAVALEPKVDTAAEAAGGASLTLDRPAEAFPRRPAAREHDQEFLGVSELVATWGIG